jgi:hypothetical protein
MSGKYFHPDSRIWDAGEQPWPGQRTIARYRSDRCSGRDKGCPLDSVRTIATPPVLLPGLLKEAVVTEPRDAVDVNDDCHALTLGVPLTFGLHDRAVHLLVEL